MQYNVRSLKKDCRRNNYRVGTLSIRMKTISVFYCLLYAIRTEGADIHAEGFEGGEVSFRCSHRLAWKNHKYFCKDLCKDSEDLLVSVESGRRAESGRITLVDSGDGVFTVTFSQLQLSDSGRYWCAVDRPGFDTFIEIRLTVMEVVANETTAVIPEVSSTWTYQSISNSTQLTPGMDISRPTSLSTASNSIDVGQPSISAGAVLYATVGAIVVMLTILVLATCYRKHRENSELQAQVRCSYHTDLSADERQAGCEEVVSIKNLPERFSCNHHPKQHPPTSASTAAECNTPIHIYENSCCSKGTAGARCSAADVQREHDISSGIYIQPLQSTISKTTGDGSPGKHTNQAASACHSRSCMVPMK